ncbi:hypothetical protein [Neobacillus sp. DY30]|uniref:hypothetical protein n=1 Tax=Neobacillus sp. DY30 TaxID=3047871 RepID=UPI0024C03CDE|nr:hypothetical protein [Neobacillus sp. DY30]WHX98014.1 hypothetical protein QNH29_15150 [Neobacillus sp. DY30]
MSKLLSFDTNGKMVKIIKREMPFGGEIVKVKCNLKDMTEQVKELEKAPLE